MERRVRADSDVRNMTQQLERSREKLSRSRTERESNAAQREIEELRKLVRIGEEIGKLTASAEASRQQIVVTEADHGKLSEELGTREITVRNALGRGRWDCERETR